ncbi:Arc family DNA-binding protein [Methylorubrum populi]|uniref:Arc family DNA-binding protein n=1 Tax=Methylorubrum populi TaxID=223967 RepID=UPI00114E4D1F|nr:Arc family DNA-binding protein [Methylorubrum populi]QDI82366.1 Arc family DNA-binding protein [Methylorubrum populi]
MLQGQRDWPKLMLRLPPDIKAWIIDQAAKHATSQNSEIIRSIRERMERSKPTTGESLQAEAPAAGPDDTALQGGPITHG